jgi:DNA-binding protein HU-beta
MTKAELVAKISSEAGITKSQADKAVEAFVSAVSAVLSGG